LSKFVVSLTLWYYIIDTSVHVAFSYEDECLDKDVSSVEMIQWWQLLAVWWACGIYRYMNLVLSTS